MKILVTDDSKMARKMVIKILNDVLNENVEIFEGQKHAQPYLGVGVL